MPSKKRELCPLGITEQLWGDKQGPCAFSTPRKFNPVLTRKDVLAERPLFVEDPFLFRVDHLWHQAFESYNFDADPGEITSTYQ